MVISSKSQTLGEQRTDLHVWLGKHWTLEEVRAHFAPSEESIEAVKLWLVGSGIPSEYIEDSDDKQWIGINIPVRQAEDLLGAEYHEHNDQDGNVRIGCDE